jgi:hypothetical protein
MATRTCAFCGGEGARIDYGLAGQEFADAADRDEIALGGYVVGDEDPNRQAANVETCERAGRCRLPVVDSTEAYLAGVAAARPCRLT